MHCPPVISFHIRLFIAPPCLSTFWQTAHSQYAGILSHLARRTMIRLIRERHTHMGVCACMCVHRQPCIHVHCVWIRVWMHGDIHGSTTCYLLFGETRVGVCAKFSLYTCFALDGFDLEKPQVQKTEEIDDYHKWVQRLKWNHWRLTAWWERWDVSSPPKHPVTEHKQRLCFLMTVFWIFFFFSCLGNFFEQNDFQGTDV